MSDTAMQPVDLSGWLDHRKATAAARRAERQRQARREIPAETWERLSALDKVLLVKAGCRPPIDSDPAVPTNADEGTPMGGVNASATFRETAYPSRYFMRHTNRLFFRG